MESPPLETEPGTEDAKTESPAEQDMPARAVHGIKVTTSFACCRMQKITDSDSVVHSCQCCSLYNPSFWFGQYAGLFDLSLLSRNLL